MFKNLLSFIVIVVYIGASNVLAHNFAMDKLSSETNMPGCASMQHMETSNTDQTTPGNTNKCYNDCFGAFDESSFAKISEDTITQALAFIFPGIDIKQDDHQEQTTDKKKQLSLFSLGPPYDDFFKNTIKIE